MEEKQKQRARSIRKQERNRIKRLIEKRFMEEWNWGDVDFGFEFRLRDKIWVVRWHKYMEFPDWFDSYAREGLENEPHIKGLAEWMNQLIWERVQKAFPNSQCHRVKKEYNLVSEFPPLWISIPDRYQNINGEWVKVEDARVLSDEEMEAFIQEGKMKDPSFDEKWWRSLFEREKKAMKYFEFVGGSAYEDELWRVKKWLGMRVYGEFLLPAEGEFLPCYAAQKVNEMAFDDRGRL
ncbi:hypothetical protein [Geobacillus subterraneus]|uniref:Uncharacterized protein n=1 Tax=Geobacillus subterraneus TaxID=129338 RepID=A0A679FRT3_9BACL|nr:hypothetical protein [Geobacillus subterraneus]BBW98873.1 hypothetical protein GsuE55_37060 [Geobacillus subterraneus]